MNVDHVKAFCLSLPQSYEKISGEPANIHVFKVKEKQFAYFKTSDPERWRFSLRVSPERFLELTDQGGVKPARYMHRSHWISIVDVASFDETYLQELIEWSYDKAVKSLSKKDQLQIQSYSQHSHS
ncbi:MmcQ/YjbR family DNA-binding protein [Hahella ganghwensis]|uniref:MmcQ/YjbR family DNA-binding protein n=1 Tax=Hahella ganghwensis TaxID=286420 RepID=UPI000381FC49|nr:MmcQ/YjbR family DNA-binding protein [Hahella ganghwensis]